MLHIDKSRQGATEPRLAEDRMILRQEVIAALAKLTPKQREAVLLTVALGLTQEEAGDAAGVTQGAISRRLQRSSSDETGQM